MTIRTLASSIALSSARLDSSSFIRELVSHRFLSSVPLVQFRCRPETQTAQVITWEPVILPLLERLTELRSRPEEERWPEADWPVDEAFRDAGKFTERLPMQMRVAPHISLADDGEVNFTWSQGGVWIDLGFYGTGTFSYYARDEEGKEMFGDDMPVMSPFPDDLRTLLAG